MTFGNLKIWEFSFSREQSFDVQHEQGHHTFSHTSLHATYRYSIGVLGLFQSPCTVELGKNHIRLSVTGKTHCDKRGVGRRT